MCVEGRDAGKRWGARGVIGGILEAKHVWGSLERTAAMRYVIAKLSSIAAVGGWWIDGLVGGRVGGWVVGWIGGWAWPPQVMAAFFGRM